MVSVGEFASHALSAPQMRSTGLSWGWSAPRATPLAAISRFAGPDLEHAVVEPAAQAALAAYDPTVTHHTVVVDTVGTNARIGQ